VSKNVKNKDLYVLGHDITIKRIALPSEKKSLTLKTAKVSTNQKPLANKNNN